MFCWGFFCTFKYQLPLEEPQKCWMPHSYQELPVGGPLCPCTVPLQAMGVTMADKPKFLISAGIEIARGLPGSSCPICHAKYTFSNKGISITSRLHFKVELVYLPPLLWGFLAWFCVGGEREEGSPFFFFYEMLEAHLMKIIFYVIFCEKSAMWWIYNCPFLEDTGELL